jgi:hypothetical protein
VTFSSGDAGAKTLTAGATLRLAGAHTLSATDTTTSSLTSSTNIEVFAAAPAALVAASGDAQVGLAGEALSLPLVARLQDAFGNAVVGASVTFAVVDGGGSVATPSATTDGSGVASTGVALGNVAGATQLFRASAAGFDAPFVAMAIAGPASTLVLFGVPSNTQAGVAHTVRVEARDRHGNLAVEHAASLAFSSTDAAATLPLSTSFAGAGGVLEFNAALVLRAAGTQTVTVGDGTLSASAEAAVSAAAPASIVVVDGASQSAVVGAALPAPFVVRVVDAFGNSVAGVGLAWAPVAGGSVTPTSTTDDTGRAEASATLGTVAGDNAFVVRAGLLEATLAATARAGDATSFVVTAPATPFSEERTAVIVEAHDAFGNVAVD